MGEGSGKARQISLGDNFGDVAVEVNRVFVSTEKVAKEIAHRAFPEWGGRRIQYEVAAPDHVFDLNNYGGSNFSNFVLFHLDTDKMEQVPKCNNPAYTGKDYSAKIVPGLAIIENASFESHDMGVRIHLHPDDAPRFMPKSTPTKLSWADKVVLASTSLKASYNGVSNLRETEAIERTGITPDEYRSAKASLIESKFLTRSGAITDAGRNAIGDADLWKLAHRPQ